MNTLDKEHVRSVVNTIFSQLLHTTPIDVINSWGISKMYATQIVKKVNGEDFRSEEHTSELQSRI